MLLYPGLYPLIATIEFTEKHCSSESGLEIITTKGSSDNPPPDTVYNPGSIFATILKSYCGKVSGRHREVLCYLPSVCS